jgi:hypothetical protein
MSEPPTSVLSPLPWSSWPLCCCARCRCCCAASLSPVAGQGFPTCRCCASGRAPCQHGEAWGGEIARHTAQVQQLHTTSIAASNTCSYSVRLHKSGSEAGDPNLAAGASAPAAGAALPASRRQTLQQGPAPEPAAALLHRLPPRPAALGPGAGRRKQPLRGRRPRRHGGTPVRPPRRRLPPRDTCNASQGRRILPAGRTVLHMVWSVHTAALHAQHARGALRRNSPSFRTKQSQQWCVGETPRALSGGPGDLAQCCVLRRIRTRRGLHRRPSIECCLRQAPTQSISNAAACSAGSAGVRAGSREAVSVTTGGVPASGRRRGGPRGGPGCAPPAAPPWPPPAAHQPQLWHMYCSWTLWDDAAATLTARNWLLLHWPHSAADAIPPMHQSTAGLGATDGRDFERHFLVADWAGVLPEGVLAHRYAGPLTGCERCGAGGLRCAAVACHWMHGRQLRRQQRMQHPQLGVPGPRVQRVPERLLTSQVVSSDECMGPSMPQRVMDRCCGAEASNHEAASNSFQRRRLFLLAWTSTASREAVPPALKTPAALDLRPLATTGRSEPSNKALGGSRGGHSAAADAAAAGPASHSARVAAARSRRLQGAACSAARSRPAACSGGAAVFLAAVQLLKGIAQRTSGQDGAGD